MPAPAQCRLGLYLGLNTISYVKVERLGSQWRVASRGDLSWQGINSPPEQCQQELRAIFQNLSKQHGLAREPVHVSLHNRLCVTRVVTGNRQQVEDQLAEIVDNSQHYLQLGLGDKLIGHSTVAVDGGAQYGQVAIIKRGLIETIEQAASQASLELACADGALTSICRLAGLAGLDQTPLLLVWLGSSGADIGISYQGRLQLNYHARDSENAELAAQTIGKHLKRLRRFCERYRQVNGSSDLRRVLALAGPEQVDELKQRLQQFDFERVHTLADLRGTQVEPHLGGVTLDSPSVASALGGLLFHLEPDLLPPTDVLSLYIASKPQSLSRTIFRDGWPLLVSAAVLMAVLCASWGLKWNLARAEAQYASLSSNFDEQRNLLLELDRQRQTLREFQRLQQQVERHAVRDILIHVAHCLPQDTRLDWCGLDTQGELVLKGTMLHGDRTYEVLKALRELPEISEVALESVGSASNYGKTATIFEIHCEIAEQPAKSSSNRVANGGTPDRNPRRQER